jgi:hypothetical protein
MRFYWPITKIDAEQRMVWGYASTEALDEQGEIIKREALDAALGNYMRFANIREMHQPSAVGVAKEATLDEKGLYIAAKIIDDDAWEKVVQGVYKGFSIGGRVTARDPVDRNVIIGLTLTEISVVDRPANPEAVFDCWKASGGDQIPNGSAFALDAARQFWACGDPGHHHLNRAEADGCICKRAAASEAAGLLPHAGGRMLARTADVADPAGHIRRTDASAEKWATASELAKVHGQSSELVKMVTELGAVIGRIAKQVDAIAHTPLPSQTIAYPHGFTRVSKSEDIGNTRALASDEDIVERFAKLSPTEQTMLLIKAAYRNPMRPGGIGQTDGDAT